MKKRISLLLILAISFAMLLSACGNSEKSSSQGKNGEKVLRFATWDTGESLKYQQDIAKKFEKANPGVKVQVEAYADGFEDKLAASFGAKNPPDVMYMWNYPDYYKSLEPLDDYVNKDSSFKTTFDDFYTNIVNYHKFKNTTYGFPVGFTTRVIYYNKKLFQEAGVPLPTSGWTWEQFSDAAKKLSNPEKKQYGFVLSSKKNSYAFQEYVWSNGSSFISPDGKKVDGYMNSSKTKEILNGFQHMIDENSAIVSDKVTESFKSGKIAMIENGIWPLEDFKKAGMDFGTAEIPSFHGQPSKGVIHSAGIAMAKDSKEKDLAWKFIKYFVSAEAAEMRKTDMPVLKSVVSEQSHKNDQLLSTFYTMLERSSDTPGFLLTNKWTEVDKKLDYAISSVLLGQNSADKALNEAVKLTEPALKK
ncbi:sugar ABC transporter substrate-binding protein [Bacillus cereus]|uniref:Sugar ABC transporter substrate-binding protein n=1 Tax=Bacillus cereus TaxID=1396 RepID=A0A2C1F997_BACCE|nr:MULTISPECIES: sugar ABC transporter substrate-binding protein [Bacillus cereus group]MDR4984567.1 sugar ABC transporter substrate-binding protein [Bacillus cereus]MEA1010997.1 sugar ABC transporter substrate-binding protein [Bacillus cereus]PES98087.1 sugar ABC transporter substrate-binding protein [Bacillus cereus]PFP82519.1 sugar ABC transporter substrate-binding protein [Bacillus cereus]PGT20939.1 sugar ABC transporter substrate-binding protein [Bacillus cereus]